jgi:hypothetical protein
MVNENKYCVWVVKAFSLKSTGELFISNILLINQ